MAKPPRSLNHLLSMIYDKPMTHGEICKSTNVNRVMVWKNCTKAERNGWIKKDELERYHLTESGRSELGKRERSLETVSFEVHTQIIPATASDKTDTPTAKCSLTMKDAGRIKELDDKTSSYERFLPIKGLGLIENSTNIKAAAAGLIDAILDHKSKDMGLHTVLDSELRDNYTIDERFPGYDDWKRSVSLAGTKIRCLVEYDGEEWVKRQNLAELEKHHENSSAFFKKLLQNVASNEYKTRIEQGIRMIAPGTNLSKSLEDVRLFESKEDAQEYVSKNFDRYQIQRENKLKKVVKTAFDSGLIELEYKPLYYLKVNKQCLPKFYNSLQLQDSKLDLNPISYKLNNQNTSDNTSANIYNDIIFKISKELEDLEKDFFALLRMAVEKWQKAYIDYHLSYKDKGPTYDHVSSMHAANDLIIQFFSIFYDILHTYMFRSTILWPEKVKDKSTLKKIHSIIFTKISDMRLRISSMLSTVHTGEFDKLFFYDNTMWWIYATQNLLEYVNIFKNSGMEKESEVLIDSLWNLRKEYIEMAFPEAKLYKWDFNYNADNWKKFIELQTRYPDQTYQNFVKNNLHHDSSLTIGF